MKRENWNRDWYFTKGQAGMMNAGKKVQLPHDYMIESDVVREAPAAAAMGYFTGTVGTYTKYFHVPEQWQGERVYLHFDGVMMNASVSVNGSLVKRHHYGYTPFSVDVTDALYFGGENRVTVAVNPSMQPNSRWYTGAGIYRHVELSHVKSLHVEPDGIFAYTKRIDYETETGTEAGKAVEAAGDGKKPERPDRAKSANVMVEVTLRSHFTKDHQVRVRAGLVLDGGKMGAGGDGCQTDNRAATGKDGYRTEAEIAATLSDCSEKDGESAVIQRDTILLVKAGSTAVARIPMTVERPLTWDAEHPNLYQVKVQVEDMGVFGVGLEKDGALEGVCDEAETLFGIRMVTADAVHGLQVNGRTVKLKGGCIHHDNGLLGAISLRDSEYRKLRLLKESGFNAVRLAHNPGSRQLLEACDRLGLYVFDEAFDAWGHSKQPGDYGQFFASDWKEDMESFILRDRNHPSILIWSTGNEVEERGGMGDGYTIAEELAACVRSLDSTRLVSNGLCSMWSGLDDASFLEQTKASVKARKQGNAQNADAGGVDGAWEDRTESFCNCLDVVGYNYMDSHYEYAGQRYPERVILGTESFPNQFDKVWELVERLPYVIGDFTWTAVDYIGEAGIGKSKFFEAGDPELEKGPWAISSHASEYPWRLANDADLTIGGSLTPQGVYRKIVWGSSETGLFAQHPKYHGMEEVVSNWGWNQMTDCWNYGEYAGKPVKVYVYSKAEAVELFLNGKSLGRGSAGKENRFCAVFEVSYEPGVLTAVSLSGDKEVSRAQIATTGAPASIRLTADRETLRADGESLSYIAVDVLDKDGNVVKDAEVMLEASLEASRATGHALSPVRKLLGDEEGMEAVAAAFGGKLEEEEPDSSACLAGFGSDNPVTEDNYAAGKCHSYQGRALAVVRAGQIAGKAVLRVAADGLGEAGVEIAVE